MSSGREVFLRIAAKVGTIRDRELMHWSMLHASPVSRTSLQFDMAIPCRCSMTFVGTQKQHVSSCPRPLHMVR